MLVGRGKNGLHSGPKCCVVLIAADNDWDDPCHIEKPDDLGPLIPRPPITVESRIGANA